MPIVQKGKNAMKSLYFCLFLLSISTTGMGNTRYLSALPTRFVVDSIAKEVAKTDTRWMLDVCLKVYNPSLWGSRVPPIPSKKKEGDISKTLFKDGSSRAGIRVDWSPLEMQPIQWLDGSFVKFDNGEQKKVRYVWRRTTFIPDYEGYEVCASIPFEKKYSFEYIKKKLSTKFVLGLIEWESSFYLDRIVGDVIASSYFFKGSSLTLPIVSLHSIGSQGSKISDLYESANVINMLRLADDTIDVGSIEEFMEIKKLRENHLKMVKDCGFQTQKDFSIDALNSLSRRCKGLVSAGYAESISEDM